MTETPCKGEKKIKKGGLKGALTRWFDLALNGGKSFRFVLIAR